MCSCGGHRLLIWVIGPAEVGWGFKTGENLIPTKFMLMEHPITKLAATCGSSKDTDVSDHTSVAAHATDYGVHCHYKTQQLLTGPLSVECLAVCATQSYYGIVLC